MQRHFEPRDISGAVTLVAWRATNPGRNSIDAHFSLEVHLPDPDDFEQVVDHRKLVRYDSSPSELLFPNQKGLKTKSSLPAPLPS
jgi:hypothetical protein